MNKEQIKQLILEAASEQSGKIPVFRETISRTAEAADIRVELIIDKNIVFTINKIVDNYNINIKSEDSYLYDMYKEILSLAIEKLVAEDPKVEEVQS